MREVRGEEEDGCGGGRDGGQGAGDNNEVKILNEVMGGRLIARRAGDTTIKTLVRRRSLSQGGVTCKESLARSLLREDSSHKESLLSRGVSLVPRELLVGRSLSSQGVSHCEEFPNEVTGGRLVARRAGDTTIKMLGR